MKIYFAFSIVVILSFFAYGYDGKSHQDICEYAYPDSVAISFLQKYLKISKDEVFNQKSPLEWIKQGANDEDDPIWHTVNHFHNPMKPWSQAQFSDCPFLPFSRQSSILWMNDPSNAYSYPKASNLFYSALVQTDADQRNLFFSGLFETLGHLMHLVQDASVPLHVRNDCHMKTDAAHYEYWIKNNEDISIADLNNITFSISTDIFQNIPMDPSYYSKMNLLIDADIYDGTNPLAADGTVGISEYANSHFFSPKTPFTCEPYTPADDIHYFPHPCYEDLLHETLTLPDPLDPSQAVRHIYFFRDNDGNGDYTQDVDDLIAVNSALEYYRKLYFPDI